MLDKLYIEEKHEETSKWSLSFNKPAFQGGQTIEIDEETAKELLKINKTTKSGMYGEMEKFQEATNPVIKFMNDNPKMFNPHSKITITPNTAEADTLEIKFTNNEFLKD